METSLTQMTIRVGRGSVAPNPSNSEANVGITFHRIAATTSVAVAATAAGYATADIT